MGVRDLTVVTTSYNSENTILAFIDQTSRAVAEIGLANWELIIVDDGSMDSSVELINQRILEGAPITLIELSRNWGQTPAIRTGLEHAKGNTVFLIDSDLEEDPALLKVFYTEFFASSHDMIFGRQKKRRGGFLEVISGIAFYKLFRFLTGVNQPDNIMTVRIMSTRFVKSLLLFKEFNLNLGAVWSFVGFSTEQLLIDKPRKWKTNYNWSGKLVLAIRALVSHSSIPLTTLAILGYIFSGIAFLLSIYWVLVFVITGAESGFTTVAVSIWLLGGFTSLTVSTLALYIGSIYDEVKHRPHSIIKQISRQKGV